MKSDSPRIRSLLRQANRTESAGKRAAAEQIYRQVLDEEPDSVDGWLGLARVIKDPNEKEEAYNKALELDPECNEAKVYLDPNFNHADLIGDESDTDSESSDGRGDTDELAAAEPLTLSPASEKTEGDKVKNGNGLGTESDQAWTVAASSDHDHEAATSREVLYCANHPNRQTNLRCNRCGKPICSSCAQPTPVGYRCPECIREHEDIFYSATAIDYVVAVVISLPLAIAAGYIASLIGFFAIFLAAIVGSFLGRIVFRATGRRRGRGMPELVAGAVVLGGIPPLLFDILGGSILGALFIGIYIVTASGAAYYQMR